MRIEEASLEYIIELTKRCVIKESVYIVTSNMDIVKTKILKVTIFDKNADIIVNNETKAEILHFCLEWESALEFFAKTFDGEVKKLNNYIKEYEAL